MRWREMPWPLALGRLGARDRQGQWGPARARPWQPPSSSQPPRGPGCPPRVASPRAERPGASARAALAAPRAGEDRQGRAPGGWGELPREALPAPRPRGTGLGRAPGGWGELPREALPAPRPRGPCLQARAPAYTRRGIVSGRVALLPRSTEIHPHVAPIRPPEPLQEHGFTEAGTRVPGTGRCTSGSRGLL